jgi:RNA polymerase sigma factor (sigma-70 family)
MNHILPTSSASMPIELVVVRESLGWPCSLYMGRGQLYYLGMSDDEALHEDGETLELRSANERLFRARRELVELEQSLAGYGITDSAGLGSARRAEVRQHIAELDQQIVSLNEGLVWHYAKQFVRGRSSNSGDLHSAGMEGLAQAIATYVESKGSFASWAFLHIRREVLREVRLYETPGLSRDEFELRPRVLSALRQLQDQTGSEQPELAQVADASGVSIDKVERILASSVPDSLDGGNEVHHTGYEGTVARNTLFDERPTDPEIQATKSAEIVQEVLREVPIQDLVAFILRGNLDDSGGGDTLEQVGNKLGKSSETIRKAEKRVKDQIARQRDKLPPDF